MTTQINYFKIGLFTVCSLALAVAFLIFLGVSSLFKPSQLAETYFNESVQGLNIGSPVKYRGVAVGEVTAIGMVSELYNNSKLSNQEQRYIYVRFSLSQQLRNTKVNQKNVQKIINGYVENGLRASLATQDLVGNAYLSLNFDDEKHEPILPISWTPDSIYIPSAQSTLSQVTDNLSNIASQLNQINFAKIMNDFDQLTLTLNKSVQDIQAQHLSEKLDDALTKTSTAMQQINLLSAKANLLVTNQEKNWETTFSELRQMSVNLASMSNTLRNNPSAAIFGKPAEPMDPTK